jgi:signal peptidase II
VLAGIAAFLLLLILDQLTKYAACVWLKPVHSIDLLPGVFQLYYLENRGAAFGILHDRQLFFIAAALVITVLVAWVYRRIPDGRRYDLLRCVCILLAAGAVGNMLDRIFRGVVVDFFYISLIDFPVFNVADCYVCIGVGLLIILLFTYYKDESFEFLRPGRREE